MSTFHEDIKSLFEKAVSDISNQIDHFSMNPKVDFSRNRKLPAGSLLSFLVSKGSHSTAVELLDYFKFEHTLPSTSAFNQQRKKLKPEAFQALFYRLNTSIEKVETFDKFRLLAVDGSTCTFSSTPNYSPHEAYYTCPGNSTKGAYSIHLNALYDLEKQTYIDAQLQPVRKKDEYHAFCLMVDRQKQSDDATTIYIGDRGYCSYNNMAHVMENHQLFLFRAKDITSQGILSRFSFPSEQSFDVDQAVTLVRSHSKKIGKLAGEVRFIDQAATFDYLDYGSYATYPISFRIVRFPLSDTIYECILTNLPRETFPPEKLKQLYFKRWGVETSFRKLKYTIGLKNFLSKQPQLIEQEIWAKLIAYNLTETLVHHTVREKKETKHVYQVNFSVAAHICHEYFRLTTDKKAIHVMALLQKIVLPIRENRSYPRLNTAHFRRPPYFLYRAS